MKRTATLCALAALALSLAPRAEARPGQTYRYAATGVGGVVNVVSRPRTPAGHVAAFGEFDFFASSNSFALRVDDLAVRKDATLAVYVWHGGGGHGLVCVPDSRWVTFGATRGEHVSISFAIDDAPPGYPRTCDAAASAGTATLLA